MNDVDELRVELAAATEEALELADRLADLALTRVAGPVAIAQVAREYQKKRVEAKRLRRAVVVEVAG